ncbi:MAG: hemerythrin domain-containing protein [Ignavibacterium sp.]
MEIKKTDLFTFIHKAIRNMIYTVGTELQTVDFADKSESKKFLDSLNNNLELLHEHAIHEDEIIFPEIQSNESEMIESLTLEHQALDKKLNQIKSMILEFEKYDDQAKLIEQGNKLNFMCNDFFASYIIHMNHEEETVLEASQKYLSDEELIAIRNRIQSKIPSERYKVWMKYMLPSLNFYELTGLLSGLRKSAPVQVYENFLMVAEELINKDRWAKVKEAILSE